MPSRLETPGTDSSLEIPGLVKLSPGSLETKAFCAIYDEIGWFSYEFVWHFSKKSLYYSYVLSNRNIHFVRVFREGNWTQRGNLNTNNVNKVSCLYLVNPVSIQSRESRDWAIWVPGVSNSPSPGKMASLIVSGNDASWSRVITWSQDARLSSF